MTGLAIAAGALAIGFLASRHASSPDPRAGSEALGPGPDVVITRVPPAYRIVYREDFGTTVRTQELSVRRPFESRRTIRAGPPPGGATLDEQVSSLNHIKLRPSAEAAQVLIVPPAPAPFDVRLDGGLDDLISAHGLERRERRSVVGRTCQVFRSSDSIDTTVTPLVTGATTYTDSCVDEAGLALETRRVEDGATTYRSVAVAVTESPDFTADAFAVEATSTVPVSRGGGTVSQIDPMSPTIAMTVALPVSPDGFSFVGRYAVAAQEQSGPTGRPGQGSRAVGVFDVYTRGADFISVGQGSNTGFVPLAESAFATVEHVGVLGDAEVIPGTRQSEVRVEIGRGGEYIGVAGTLPPVDLVAVARDLRKTTTP